MNRIECSPEKPWGIHSAVRNDEDCPRCGWTAPGRHIDSSAQAVKPWTLIQGGVANIPSRRQAA